MTITTDAAVTLLIATLQRAERDRDEQVLADLEQIRQTYTRCDTTVRLRRDVLAVLEETA